MPFPSIVFVLNATVGLLLVPHTTPLAIRSLTPPIELTLPPDFAPDILTSVITFVVSVGIFQVLTVRSLELWFDLPAWL